MKIYTCALMPFTADQMFFTRDSGLLCRSLQALGVQSNVIMPTGPSSCGHTDPKDVIRANEDQFANPEWWKSLGIDGVVFIAWGFKQHTPIIRAARAARIRTCALFDCNGDPFPYGDLLAKPRILWRKGKFIVKFPYRLAGTAARVLLCALRGIRAQYHRSVQIGVPDVAAFQTPKSMDRVQNVARLFPWIDSGSKKLVMGYPIPDSPDEYMASQRQAKVVAVARWDALRHKRPHMLMKVIDQVLSLHANVTFEIFGRLIPEMQQWHASLESSYRERVKIHGVKSSATIMEAIHSSQILYCPSVEEGVPLPVIEALCGGCTVAGLGTPAVPGLYWGISEGYGSAARTDSVTAHADALMLELAAWKAGRRDPKKISQHWKHWFSSREVATRIIEIITKFDTPISSQSNDS